MFYRYTKLARRVVYFAKVEAAAAGDEHTGSRHCPSRRTWLPWKVLAATLLTLDPDGDKRDLTIVGVVSDASLWSIKSPHPLAVYETLAQNPSDGLTADLRFSGELRAIEPAVRQAVNSLGRQFPILTETLDTHEDRFLKEDRVIALISAFLGELTVLLSAIGIYGFLSKAVTSRTGEIGVRVAVGATRLSVVWLVMREVAGMCAVGLTVGLLTGLVSSRLIAGLLYDLAPNDPAAIAFAIGILSVVALSAAYVPARRASRIDPLQALRAE